MEHNLKLIKIYRHRKGLYYIFRDKNGHFYRYPGPLPPKNDSLGHCFLIEIKKSLHIRMYAGFCIREIQKNCIKIHRDLGFGTVLYTHLDHFDTEMVLKL